MAGIPKSEARERQPADSIRCRDQRTRASRSSNYDARCVSLELTISAPRVDIETVFSIRQLCLIALEISFRDQSSEERNALRSVADATSESCETGFRGKGFQKVALNNQPTLPLVELKFFTVQAANLKTLVIRGDQVYSSFREFWFDAPKRKDCFQGDSGCRSAGGGDIPQYF